MSTRQRADKADLGKPSYICGLRVDGASVLDSKGCEVRIGDDDARVSPDSSLFSFSRIATPSSRVSVVRMTVAQRMYIKSRSSH